MDIMPLAAELAQLVQESLDNIYGSLKGRQPDQDRCGSLTLYHHDMGIAELVLQQNAAPMIEHFRNALNMRVLYPRRRLTRESTHELEMAILCRDRDLALRLTELVITNPPPPLDSDGIHHVACLQIAGIRRDPNIQRHVQALQRGDWYELAYGKMLGGALEGDAARIEAGAKAYLAKHRQLATRGSLKRDPYGLAAIPVLAALQLAKDRGLVVNIQDPYVPMCALD